VAHAETETYELDHGERNRDEKPDQQEPSITRRRRPAQAALPRQTIARETQTTRIAKTRSRGADDITLDERLTVRALWNHKDCGCRGRARA
jgi:hypothetical protein